MKALAARKHRVNPKAARYALQIKRSSLHRLGLFALEDVPRGRRVIEYTGKRLPFAQAWKLTPSKDTYVAGMNTGWYVDGSRGGSGAEFANHSCEPNLLPRYIGGRMFLFSRRKIRAGEELTWNYRYPIKSKRIPCRCGARRCRGTFRVILG